MTTALTDTNTRYVNSVTFA